MVGKEPAPSIQLAQPCRHFKFSEILAATENFDDSLVIGTGGFGKVYRGKITSGGTFNVVAIKRLDIMSNQGATEFWAEVEILSMLRHCNLVSLIGYCNYKQDMILVYDYMSNGTLDDHLHKLRTPLSWLQRLNICVGAGRGLHYLHTGTGIQSGVIHRDVKSSNILLHESWSAKISDFGLSKIGPTNQPSTYVNTHIKGTFGYLDPDYFTTGRLTRKSDVYAFGVVLLEVLCRKRAVDRSLDEEQWGLVTWAQDFIKEGNLKRIVDSDIRGEISPKCLKEYIRIVDGCLLNGPKQRPTMAQVVGSLEYVIGLQEKLNNLQSRTMFGRMLDMFSFPFNRQNSSGFTHNALQFYKSGHVTGSYKMKQLASRAFIRQSGTPSRHVDREEEFTFADLALATGNFSEDNKIAGNFGGMYKGMLLDGREVAIKRAEMSQKANSTHEEESTFNSELAFLTRLHHKHLVRLVGYCEEREEKLLVYEYMKNGTLFEHLHGKENADKSGNFLSSWKMRIKISLDAARGIEYLHNYAVPPIIHRHLKSSNIFLDVNWVAKVSDFGLSLMGSESNLEQWQTKAVGTIGYIDPVYYGLNVATTKSDVYCFGVVMLELLTGRRTIFRNDEDNDRRPINIVDYAVPAIISGEMEKVFDKRVSPPDVNEVDAVELMAYVAVDCVSLEVKERPTMADVVTSMERAMSVYGDSHGNISSGQLSINSE